MESWEQYDNETLNAVHNEYMEARSLASDILGFDIDMLFDMEFDDFKTKLSYYHASDEASSIAENAILISRYPFLLPSNVVLGFYGNRHMLERTWLDDMRVGWRKRFGLEMMEDIRNASYEPDRDKWMKSMCGIIFEQVKEKFGELRIYATANDMISSIIDVYSHLSTFVCLSCGETLGVRFKRSGWVTPVCLKCHTNTIRNLYDYNERNSMVNKQLEEIGADLDGSNRYAVTQTWFLLDFITTTKSLDTGAKIRDLHNEFTYNVYQGNEMHTINIAAGLLDGTDFKNGKKPRAFMLIDELADCADRIREYDKCRWKGESVPYDFACGETIEQIGITMPSWDSDEDENNQK